MWTRVDPRLRLKSRPESRPLVSFLLEIPPFGSFFDFWFLIGLSTGTVLAIIVVLSVIFSRGMKKGITVTINERLFDGLASKRDRFLSNLETELQRRGMIARKPLEQGYDLIYRDFFNEARIYSSPEGPNLRYGYRISATNQAIALGIVLLIPFVIGAAVVVFLALLRHNNIRQSLQEAADTSAITCRTQT